MSDVPVRAGGSFEWRVQTGRWRWVILGAIGVSPYGCSGRTNDVDGESSGSAVVTQGGTGTTETGAGGIVPATTPSNCEPPLTDLGGGWERCGNGMVHRRELGSCASKVPRPEPAVSTYPAPFGTTDAGLGGACRYDSDCTAKAYGHCEWSSDIGGTYCAYGCVTNADCGAGAACLCGAPVGKCVPASCLTDAECGSAFLCSDYAYDPGCGGRAMACQHAADSCAADIDCGEYDYCARGPYGSSPAPDQARYCVSVQCAIGRPFLIAGGERLAPEVVRSDWYPAMGSEAVVAVPCVELSDAIRRGWVDQALMEHASVAAFARFSLQLLALGAPADLVARSARAMSDEIEHARACFELARRHGPADVGPGPLDVSGALESMDLDAVLVGTIAEGCIGETVAAIEAAEASEHCEDPATRSVLERIARDETRHAELAWRFVAWALEAGPAELRERARTAFALAIEHRAPARATPTELERRLARHGLIGGSLRADLRRRVLRDVIAPCARALLDPPASVASAPRRQAPKSMDSAAAGSLECEAPTRPMKVFIPRQRQRLAPTDGG
jgi:hypothetical protein